LIYRLVDSIALPPSEWCRYKVLFTTLQATIY